MGDKFCSVIVSTFSSAGLVWRNIKMEKPGCCSDQLFLGSSFQKMDFMSCYILSFTGEFIGQWMDNGLFEGFIFLSGIFCKYSVLILDLI